MFLSLLYILANEFYNSVFAPLVYSSPENIFLRKCAMWMIIFAFVTWLLLVRWELGNKLYGRYSADSPFSPWNLKLPAKVSWFFQELPCCLWGGYCLYTYGVPEAMQEQVLLGLFLLHYVYRTFIFPFRLRSGKPTPLVLFLAAVGFCTWNGYMQVVYHSTYTDTSRSILFFYAGIIIFFIGWAMNQYSDHVLINLRADGSTGYKIPYGGPFVYLAAPNLVGEVIEWTGFAIASQSLVAVAFAIYAASNLLPRAMAHHDWYLNKFGEEYKKLHRWRVIPFLY